MSFSAFASRWLILFGVPLACAVVSVVHPRPSLDALYKNLSGVADTWLIVHVVQLFLFALMAVSVHLLIGSERGPVATLSRLAMGGFAVLYGSYDSLAGIATGVIVRTAQALPVEQQAAGATLLERYFEAVEAGAFSWIGVLGAMLWMFGLLAAAVAIGRPARPVAALGLAFLAALILTIGNDLVWQPFGYVGLPVLLIALYFVWAGSRLPLGVVLLLGFSAYILSSGHPMPFGTAAFVSFTVAAAWLEWRRRAVSSEAGTVLAGDAAV